MTLEYRCSNCGTLLQTTNADPLNDDIEQLRAVLKLFCMTDWYATGHGTFEGIVEKSVLDRAKQLLDMVPASTQASDSDICAACGAARREHTTPGGIRYGEKSLCGAFIPTQGS